MREVVVDLRRAARAKAAEVKPAPQEKPRVAWWAAAVVTAALLAGIAVGRWMLGNQASGWRNPLEGATFTRLTDFEGAEEDAIISPDGNFVTFLSDRDGHRDVWVLQIASGQFLNLT